MLERIKKHLVDCGFDIMRDFLREGDMTSVEFIGMCENITNSIYIVNLIRTWEDLLDCLNRDDLGVLGYESLDQIMADLDC
jgi:hypothetical protein